MAKPTKLPEWATGASRTLEPSAGEKTLGWEVGNKPPARKMNWLFNLVYEWLDHLQDSNEQKYSSIADSTAIVNTVTTAQPFDETYDIPADALKVGDTIKVRAVILTTTVTGTRSAQLEVRLDANSFCSIPLGTITATEDVFIVDAVLTVRAIGATGVVSGTVTVTTADLTAHSTVLKADSVYDPTVDTTQALTTQVTWQWSATGGGDSVTMVQFVVDISHTDA